MIKNKGKHSAATWGDTGNVQLLLKETDQGGVMPRINVWKTFFFIQAGNTLFSNMLKIETQICKIRL